MTTRWTGRRRDLPSWIKRNAGKLVSLLVRGTAEDTLAVLEARRPLFAEALPMTLEEVFIGEMEAAGYDYSNILS